MKHFIKKGINKNTLFYLDDPGIDYLDRDKLSFFTQDISTGIKNYVLFQNFINFRWPYWLYNTYSVKSRSFHHISPFLLLNNNNRDWISFLNRNSSKRVYTDPAGMISPEHDSWSLEFWMLERKTLYRPQERISSVYQTRDTNTFLINTRWEETNFIFTESICSIERDKESAELVIDLNSILSKGNIPIILFIVVRPYNTLTLGGIKSIEYNNKTKLININDYERIYSETKPDYMLTGNACDGDIDFIDLKMKKNSVNCRFELATMALGYNLNKGDNELKIRIDLSGDRRFHVYKVNYSNLKNEYIEQINLKSRKGLKITFPEKKLQNWIYAAKISALNCSIEDILDTVDLQSSSSGLIFYAVAGYNRMGYFSESLRIINSITDRIIIKEKPNFTKIHTSCCLINCISDYFKLSRDIGYIRSRYQLLRSIADGIIQYSKSIKSSGKSPYKNSIQGYLIKEFHIYDVIVISFALFEFSYMARCMGIFNDELKFAKESDRLEKIIIEKIDPKISDSFQDEETAEEEISGPGIERNVFIENEYFAYNIFAGFPFAVRSLTTEKLKDLTDKISSSFSENPIYFKSSGGCNSLYSIIYAINLLLVKDPRVHTIIEKFFDFGKERYVIPDFVNPTNGLGIMGQGDSSIVISAFFTLLRSAIFMDSQERLVIFPVPKKEWFIEGSEIRIEDAPSLFGIINFTVLTTRNEIQIHFYETPKYIPPEIMINLPFPSRIKQEDDFLLKKEIGNSYLIHGWPSMIRFIKR